MATSPMKPQMTTTGSSVATAATSRCSSGSGSSLCTSSVSSSCRQLEMCDIIVPSNHDDDDDCSLLRMIARTSESWKALNSNQVEYRQRQEIHELKMQVASLQLRTSATATGDALPCMEIHIPSIEHQR